MGIKLAKGPDYGPGVFSFMKGKACIGVNSLGEIIRRLPDGGWEHLPSDLCSWSEAQQLTVLEHTGIGAIWELQKLNTGFSRIWGGLVDRDLRINLSVEFCAFCDDACAWRRLDEWVRQHKGLANVMDHRQHLDKWRHEGAKRWNTGPNHNRWETQIDVIWNVADMRYKQVEALIQSLRKSAEQTRVWNDYGVGVI